MKFNERKMIVRCLQKSFISPCLFLSLTVSVRCSAYCPSGWYVGVGHAVCVWRVSASPKCGHCAWRDVSQRMASSAQSAAGTRDRYSYLSTTGNLSSTPSIFNLIVWSALASTYASCTVNIVSPSTGWFGNSSPASETVECRGQETSSCNRRPWFFFVLVTDQVTNEHLFKSP